MTRFLLCFFELIAMRYALYRLVQGFAPCVPRL